MTVVARGTGIFLDHLKRWRATSAIETSDEEL